MLSNPPPSGLQQRLRQHRRQKSTPTTFDLKIATEHNLSHNNAMHLQRQQQLQQSRQNQPIPAGRQRVLHRRGMSLDTRRQPMQSPTTTMPQELLTVSTTTNTGLANTPQHVLREAQQQRLTRPGPHQHQQQALANLASDENYLMSPNGTPQMQGYDVRCFDGLSGPSQNMGLQQLDMYHGQMEVLLKKDQEDFNSNMAAAQDFELFPSSALSTPTFMNFHESPSGGPGWISEGDTASTRRSSRRISNGIMDRVAKFETMGMEGPTRPLTPPHQNAADYFPLTPMETPHDRTIKHSSRPQRFTEGYDESMEETLKPGHRQQNRPRNNFEEMRQAAEGHIRAPQPHRAHTMPMPSQFEEATVSSQDFMGIGNIDAGTMGVVTQFDGLPTSDHPLSAGLSAHASPMGSHIPEFASPFDSKPELRPSDAISELMSGDASSSTEKPSRRGSPHRRTESVASVASIASAASIASIDIEQTKTETGITIDDIQQYIDGPDPRDNKWVCTFDDCNKRFGRKENIKSHVQTHLNDRQYQCPTCKKCFVRQHDLKRHAKIHTGIKPYPCECGNSFARHDALTRHKQRGMCIGAFDGIVRKVVKRGRPRKHRPDMDERKDKSARTRKKNKSNSSDSSQSGYSDSSAPNSPENPDTDFDMVDDIMDVSIGGTATLNPAGLQGSPGLGPSTAPMPALSANLPLDAHSPSAASIHSYVSQLSLAPGPMIEPVPSHPASPAKSVASQFNEPPELSQSSSPPSCNRYFDMEPNTSGSSAELMITSAGEVAAIPSMAGLDDSIADDYMLQFTHSEPNMLMLSSDGKFDETFDNPMSMFTNNDDLFFPQ